MTAPDLPGGTPGLEGRTRVLAALELLMSELPAAEGWENDDLAGFLEAFHALLASIEHVYANAGEPVPRDAWLLVAEALTGARTYE